MIHYVIGAMGVGRILLGLVPILAAALGSRLLGFPETHDNPTSRLMARFFGVRDIGLGVLAFYGLAHPLVLPFLLLFNAAMDCGDMTMIAIPLVQRENIDRAAWRSMGFALPAFAAWLTVFFWVTR